MGSQKRRVRHDLVTEQQQQKLTCIIGMEFIFSLPFLFLKDFLMWTIFKVLIEFLQYCSCLMLWFFGCEACRILAPQPGIELAPPALECKVLTTGLRGSPFHYWRCPTCSAHGLSWWFPLFTWSPWLNRYYSWVFASKEKNILLGICMFVRVLVFKGLPEDLESLD